ncbi:MAG: hypothetical protein IJ312_04105 [Treponema sp.]|nr:hypothetical protein [Treponema sp.]
MNNQALYEDTVLNLLYKVGSISTLELEPLVNKVDPQLANNIICNRTKSTSYILNGLMNYDDETQTLSITAKGRTFIEDKYSQKRG